jgi:ATP-dependent Lon protease
MAHRPTPPKKSARTLPLLPLRDIVVFPHMVSQLFVGRERSILALDEAMRLDKEVLLVAQRNARNNEPGPDDLFTFGTVGVVMQMLRLPDGTVKVLIEGKRRARVARFSQTDPFFVVDIEEATEPPVDGVEVRALCRSIRELFESYVKLNKKVQPEVLMSVQTTEDGGRLADLILASLSNLKLTERQAMLECEDPTARLDRLLGMLTGEIDILQMEKKIRSRVKKQMEKDAEGVLPQRADAGHPEGAGRRARRVRSELQEIEEKLKQEAAPRRRWPG